MRVFYQIIYRFNRNDDIPGSTIYKTKEEAEIEAKKYIEWAKKEMPSCEWTIGKIHEVAYVGEL